MDRASCTPKEQLRQFVAMKVFTGRVVVRTASNVLKAKFFHSGKVNGVQFIDTDLDVDDIFCSKPDNSCRSNVLYGGAGRHS